MEVTVDSSRLDSPSTTVTAPRAARGGWWALGLWVAVIVVARVVLLDLVHSGAHVRIPFPPLDAWLDWRPGWPLLLPAAVGATLVAYGQAFGRRARWGTLLVGATAVTLAWSVGLALLDGASGLVGSVTLKNEYFGDVGRVGSITDFLAGFTTNLADYRIHVQGHPPGFLLLLSLLDQVGLAHPWVVAWIELLGGALAVPAVLVAVKVIAGESCARDAWMFVAAAPVAIWMATSTDAFYAGVGAWAVTLVIIAIAREDRRGDRCALAGGLLFGVVAFLSYGLVLLALIPLGLAWRTRRARPLLVAAGAAATVLAAFALAGFWWLAGLAATRARYFAGVASRRPYDVFLLVNAACLAIMVGPAIAVALARLRDRSLWWLLGGALAALGIAALSGMSKGEVERIWLPFAVWLLPAGAAFAARRRAPRWLAFQLVFTIGVQTLVRSPW